MGRGLWKAAVRAPQPKILDADALNLLAKNKESVDLSFAILTPHPGEAARLLGCSSERIQHDRFTSAEQLAQKFCCTVVLKGAGTLIAQPSETLYVCHAGHPAMATAGMGDVLTGITAGLLAQNRELGWAATTAVSLHAAAGELVAARSRVPCSRPMF